MERAYEHQSARRVELRRIGILLSNGFCLFWPVKSRREHRVYVDDVMHSAPNRNLHPVRTRHRGSLFVDVTDALDV
ncbi:MAG: hypothetical protein H7144_06425 [Burkholderiales bacterium]|nr:hypothetical protein [Phycisphaerae bacterium]